MFYKLGLNLSITTYFNIAIGFCKFEYGVVLLKIYHNKTP